MSFDRAIDIDPSRPEAWGEKGWCLCVLYRDAEYEQAYKNAFERGYEGLDSCYQNAELMNVRE